MRQAASPIWRARSSVTQPSNGVRLTPLPLRAGARQSWVSLAWSFKNPASQRLGKRMMIGSTGYHRRALPCHADPEHRLTN